MHQFGASRYSRGLNFFDSSRYFSGASGYFSEEYLAAASLSLYPSCSLTKRVAFGCFFNCATGKQSSGSAGLALRYSFSRCFIRSSLGAAFCARSLRGIFIRRDRLMELIWGARLVVELAYYFTKHLYGAVVLIGVIGKGGSLSVGFNLGTKFKTCLV